MRGNSEKIKDLRHQQAKRKKNIERFKEQRKKHLFFLILSSFVYVFFSIDNAYAKFGSVVNFLLIILSILAIIVVGYLLGMRYVIDQKEKEIKLISNKIYQLMKLEDD